MTSRPAPQCLACAHWSTPDLLEPEPQQTCTAYPAGIPDEIWWNKADHRQPHAGDHDIRWESRDGATFPGYAMREAE